MSKRTALFEEHQRLSGRIVEFGGWELPIQYTGVMDEHLACREKAGLFDVSHMGEIEVQGPDACAFLDFAVTQDLSACAVGQAVYTVLCHESGGIVDDLVIYRRAPDRFLAVVNASNTAKDWDHFQSVSKEFRALNPQADFKIENQSAETSQIAIQGPQAETILQRITQTPLSSIQTYRFAEGRLLGEISSLIARTGYTGEDGFELYTPWQAAPRVWRALLEEGAPHGIKPCGLGARDTLRLEMKYPLYGHELSDETTPLEAGLGWVVKLAKASPFMGKEALSAQKAAGVKKKLVGFKLLERGIPRQGYPILADGQAIGIITSGTHSPSLKEAIGIGYVDLAHAAPGCAIQVDIRGSLVPAQIVPTPFYRPTPRRSPTS